MSKGTMIQPNRENDYSPRAMAIEEGNQQFFVAGFYYDGCSRLDLKFSDGAAALEFAKRFAQVISNEYARSLGEEPMQVVMERLAQPEDFDPEVTGEPFQLKRREGVTVEQAVADALAQTAHEQVAH